MKTRLYFFLALIFGWMCTETISAQPVVANHLTTNLSNVPTEWINQAKAELKIWYGHTSHGSQITSGIQNLQSHYGAPYTYNYSGAGGALSYQELTWADLGHNGDLYWEQLTRQQLNNPSNDRNVVVWSWCGGVSDNTVQGINIYLNAMNQLEQDYPNVKFVYMTGHRDIWADANLKARNQQIRDYCLAHNKILFDFADIESYNPEGTYFEYASDDCSYYQGPGWGYLGNWAQEWCAAHPGSDLCWSCDCAHSEPLNCNLKGRAFWWLLAKMAGWGEEQTVFYVDKNNPAASDANPGTAAEPWLTIQHAANTCQAGDSVVIRAGNYFENIVTQQSGNETDGYIVFAAYPGEDVVIDGTGNAEETGWRMQHSFIKLYGLEIYNWATTGIWIINASNFEIIGCEVHEMPFGIGISGSSHDFIIRDTEVHHFDLYGIDASPMDEAYCYNGTFVNCTSHTGRDPDQNVDGFALGHGQQHNFVFDHCTAYGVYDGFDISAASTLLTGCKSYNCFNGCYKLWQDQIELVNCIGYDAFTIVELDYNGTTTETILRNCTFYDSEVFTIWVENVDKSFQMHNCIISGGENIGLCFEQPYFSNYTGDNNLFQNIGWRAIAVGYSTEITINDIETGAWTALSGQDGNSVTASAAGDVFINPSSNDLHLKPGSPAVNNASAAFSPIVDFDGNPRPFGGLPDIGAYELQENVAAYSVNPSSVNFGSVFIGESQTAEITITNESEIPIIVDNIEVQPGAFQIPSISFPLEIEDAFTFEVTFLPSSEQNYTATLTIFSSQTFNTEVPLSGNGIEEPTGGFHVSGNVSGLWQTYDTIFVDGDIIVPNGETLTVTPVPGGTDFVFTGHYKFIVYGQLELLGNLQDSIHLWSLNYEEGWFGLRFYDLNYNGMDSSRVEFCSFRHGRAVGEDWDNDGGGIFIYESSPLSIHDCTIENCVASEAGGGIHVRYSSPDFKRLKIINNTAAAGGGLEFNGSYPILRHCVICNNTAENGGGVYVYSCAPVFDHCTLSGNQAETGGGIYNMDWAYPEFTNSIVWGNGDDDYWNYPYGGIIIASYSNIGGSGVYCGAGNINADPLFANPTNGNFDLTWANYPIPDASKSPCIDNGDPSYPLDADGTRTDMGAIPFAFQNNHIAGGEISGTWENFETLWIDGDIVVPAGETFEIIPANGGTNVIFTGHFSVIVFGSLLFTGNATDSIRIFAQNPIAGWNGIRFRESGKSKSENSEIIFCSFKNGINTLPGEGCGGAIHAQDYSNLIISNSVFTNNQATNGGAICLEFSSPVISNCEIAYNTAEDSGGGIFIGYDCFPEIFETEIHHNATVDGTGGGVYIQQGSKPFFEYGNIIANIAQSGGGIACSSDSATFLHIEILGNQAVGQWATGGGISCNANPLISHCTISGNISAGGGGGVSCNYQNSPRIEYSVISQNTAYYGGGIVCLYSSNPEIRHTEITGNQATENGGGIFVWDGSNPELTNVLLEENTAGNEGGGLYIDYASGKYTNLKIISNDAQHKGGGVCVKYDSSPLFYNALVTENTAEWGGGMIFLENSGEPVFHNFTITQNSASISGGGIACDYGDPEFFSSIFWENQAAQEGNNVYLHVPESDPFFHYSTLQNGIAGFGGDGSGENYDQTRYTYNQEDDPMFANSATFEFNLLITSPAINHGLYDTTGYDLPDIDLNGNSRISAYLIDQGCFESQEYIAPHQTLAIPAGWSGISGSVTPYFPEMERLFEPLEGNLIILKNMEGVYWPGQNVNTLGNWDVEKGYLVKLTESAEFEIPGNASGIHTFGLQPGWNLIPVMCECRITTSEIYSQLGENLIIITEPAGLQVFWPAMGIQTLQQLAPGKSYFVLVTEEAVLNFD